VKTAPGSNGATATEEEPGLKENILQNLLLTGSNLASCRLVVAARPGCCPAQEQAILARPVRPVRGHSWAQHVGPGAWVPPCCRRVVAIAQCLRRPCIAFGVACAGAASPPT